MDKRCEGRPFTLTHLHLGPQVSHKHRSPRELHLTRRKVHVDEPGPFHLQDALSSRSSFARDDLQGHADDIDRGGRADERASVAEQVDQLVQVLDLQPIVQRVAEAMRPMKQ